MDILKVLVRKSGCSEQRNQHQRVQVCRPQAGSQTSCDSEIMCSEHRQAGFQGMDTKSPILLNIRHIREALFCPGFSVSDGQSSELFEAIKTAVYDAMEDSGFLAWVQGWGGTCLVEDAQDKEQGWWVYLALWAKEGVCFSVKEKFLLVHEFSFSSHVMPFLYKAFPLPLSVSLLGMI